MGKILLIIMGRGEKAYKKVYPKTNLSAQDRAGITFPIMRILKHMRKLKANNKCRKNAAIYLSAELEYLTAEIADLTVQMAQQEGLQTLKSRHIFKAIDSDD